MAQNPRSSSNEMSSNKKRQTWTNEEDSQLIGLVKIHGENWAKIAEALEMRTGNQCRERWFNHLVPIKVTGNWTPGEERMLIEAQSRLGNKWTSIAKHLGRTEKEMTESSFCQNHPSIARNEKRKHASSDMFVPEIQAAQAQCSCNVNSLSPLENVPRENIQLGGEGSSVLTSSSELYVNNNPMTGCSFNSENIQLTQNWSAMEALWNNDERSEIKERDQRLSEVEATQLANEHLVRVGLGDLIANSNHQTMMHGMDVQPHYDEVIDSLIRGFNSDPPNPNKIFEEPTPKETENYGCTTDDQIQQQADLSYNRKGKMPTSENSGIF